MDNQALIAHPERFESFWLIMAESFPEKERRDREDYLHQLLNRDFKVKVYGGSAADIKGFIGFWELQDCVFIEHFAVSSRHRGQGLGNRILADFLDSVNAPVVLEVEPPADDITKRRIRFYERFGFALNPRQYAQPSYRPGGEPVEMKLMTNKGLLNDAAFQVIRKAVYKSVYNMADLRFE